MVGARGLAAVNPIPRIVLPSTILLALRKAA
jgi:hypothetical protein